MRVAVLGLGIIGSIWARHWAADGHHLRCWNRSPRSEIPGFCQDLATAIADAEIIAVVVADGPAVAQVLATVAPLLRPGVVVCQHSTIGVDETRRFAAQVRAQGAGYLDMPFTGSKPAAQARQVVFYAGDDADLLPQIQPLYASISRAILPLGGVGQAMAMKLAMNLNLAGIYQALAEAHRAATAAGLSNEAFAKALDLNVGRSGLSDLKLTKLINRDWSTQFSVKHLHKDLRLALAMAAQVGVTLPQTAALAQRYAQAEAAGLADADFSAVASLPV